MAQVDDVLHRVADNIEKVIIGKRRAVELTVLAMASGGHVLIEDIPGVGKTSLVSALARSVSCSFSRVQFTPDILPSDICGFSIYNPKTGGFEFRPGAVMSNFVLADEINRTTPKTQASLLEIMEEGQVTVDAKTYPLPQPFMVLATQNPVEYLGTYPLPEAEIDRFLVKISLGYPDFEQEIQVVSQSGNGNLSNLRAVASGGQIMEIRRNVKEIHVGREILSYIVGIVSATRSHSDILLGASPRGSIGLCRMSQALALYNGRDFVIPDDVKALAPSVLGHRLVLTNQAKLEKKSPCEIVEEILETMEVPVTV